VIQHHHPHHHHPHPVLRLPSWQRRVLNLTAALLLATGIVWLGVHYSVGAGAGELPHPVEVLCMRVHGAAAFAGLFALGMLAAAHVPAGWRVTRSAHRRADRASQRHTGVAMLSLAALLVVTGYALYYFAPEDWRPAMGWVHAGAGVAMAVLGFAHARWLRVRHTAAAPVAQPLREGAPGSAPR
jgi:hypothetical protein